MTGRPGKWPWKNHSVAVTPLSPTIRFASGSYSTIRSTSRNGQRCGISASISRGRVDGLGHGRLQRRVAVSLGVGRGVPCGAVCAGLHRSSLGHEPAHDRAAAARKAALPTRSSRLVVIRPSRNASLPSSARWIGDVGDEAVDDELVERGAAARDRRRPVRAPDDELAEQRVVVRRDLVAADTGASPSGRRARPARGSARRRRRRGRKSCAGSSALMRNSMAWPRSSTSAWLKPSGSPAAIRIWVGDEVDARSASR